MQTHNAPRPFPELFYGIVAPIGVETGRALAALEENLTNFGYIVKRIKVTGAFDIFLPKFKPWQSLDLSCEKTRLDTYIQYGNQLRETFRDNSILSKAALNQIFSARKAILDFRGVATGFKSTSGIAYIVHQFKRQEEVALFREVYGENFTQISLYSRRENRIDYLSRKFSADKLSPIFDDFRDDAEIFVKRDFNERDHPHGQRISKIFHNADLIVNIDVMKFDVETQIQRYLALQFGANSFSPSKAEYGMYSAKGAALRSLDLSRQVGASIFSPGGEVITMGSNEVPKARGGTYWSDESFDDREFRRGVDANDFRKRQILKEIFEISVEEGFIKGIKFEKFMSSPKMSESRFMDALEYGRIVHAEMNAITDAARLGRSILGSTLYCTTFPCHMCTKHIVSSGIEKVVFLEPYPKSLAKNLHSDSLRVEGADRAKYRDFPSVQFDHFYGVTPRRYGQLFERLKRKSDGGVFSSYVNDQPYPLISSSLPFYLANEVIALRKGVEQYQRTKPKRKSDFV